MAPKKDKVCTVFVVNVSRSDQTMQNPEFLEKAKELMKNMIEKLIFYKPTVEVGIVLMGVESDSEPRGLTTFQEIQTASWDMVEKIETIEGSDFSFGEWLKALKAALNLINDSHGEWKTSKIMLISDFPPDSSLKFEDEDSSLKFVQEFDSIVGHFVEKDMELICCGTKELRNISKEDLNNNEKKLLDFCGRVGGWYGPFDYILTKSRYYEPGRTRFCPWNCDLKLHNINIPVRVVVRVSKNEIKKPWILASVATEDGTKRDTPVPIERTKSLIDRTKTVHAKEDVVHGYMCGKNFVPVTDSDYAGLELPKENKSFLLYGVAKAETVSFTYRTGPSTWLVLPQEGYEELFYYFLRAMKNLDLIGFARRVYQNNAKNPTMNTLTPCEDDPELPACFVMHQLIFAEEESMPEVQSLIPESELTLEDKNVVGDLIDSMFVANDGEKSTEKFVRAPERQHIWNVKAFRALHPDEPLPPLKDYLMASLEPPESINMGEVKSCVNRVLDYFDLKPKEAQVLMQDPQMEIDPVNEPRDNLGANQSEALPEMDQMNDRRDQNIQGNNDPDLDDMFQD